MRMISIETARLTLRTPRASDLAAYLAYRNEPGALATQHMSPVSEAEALTFLCEQAVRKSDASGWLMLAVEDTATARMIGETGVFRAPDHLSHGNVGWWLHPDFRGKGIATEAACGLIGWCFDALELKLISASCLTDNIHSLHVMKRLKLRREEPEEPREINGIFYDQSTFAIRREGWIERDN